MKWYIVYKAKSLRCSLAENLKTACVNYYIPIQEVEKEKDGRIVLEEKNVLGNLIFVQTDEDIHQLCQDIDGLKAPYYNATNGKPAIVSDSEMQTFKDVIKMKNLKAKFLQDPFSKFTAGKKVRVRAGEFEGLEGYVLRMKGDRKFVISLGEIAVAVTGIHHSLLVPIEE